jgi:hypothetical protein
MSQNWRGSGGCSQALPKGTTVFKHLRRFSCRQQMLQMDSRNLEKNTTFVQLGFNWVTDKKSGSILIYFRSHKSNYAREDGLIKSWIKS